MIYIAEPLPRTELRSLAKAIRRFWHLENTLYLPVIAILENVMPLAFPFLSYEYVSKDEFAEKKHGETDIVNHIIRIREDIYYGALNGNGRDRMTIMHEIAHYLLLVICGIKLERNFDNQNIATYQDPEWQAKALAGEIMCPHDLIKFLPADEIALKCGVSRQAAQYNLTH